MKLSKEKLASMTKEEKLKYLDLIKEKKRREKLARPKYIPHAEQKPFHESTKTERYVFCGNSWGKTAALVNEAYWAATGYCPILDTYTKVPCKIIMLIDDAEKADMLHLPELRKWYEIPDKWVSKDGKPHTSSINFPNGSSIKFLSHGIDPMKSEGIMFDVLIADEPPPKALYNSLTRGMREKGSIKRTIIAGTPITEAWLLNEVYNPWKKGELPYADCFLGSSDANKENLDWDRQEKWLARLSPEERESRQHGKFFNLSGLAFAHIFDLKVHVIDPIEWPRNWPVVVAIDPAGSKPHVACMLGVDPQNNLYYITEISLRAPARDFARKLKEWYRDYPVKDIVCDSLGSSGMSGGEGLSSFIEVLNDEGVRARPTRYDEKNEEKWIANIQEALYFDKGATDSQPKLRIFKGNYGIINDIEGCQWQKIKGTEMFRPKLDISKKDYLATLKYALACNLVYTSPARRLIQTPSVSWRDREIY